MSITGKVTLVVTILAGLLLAAAGYTGLILRQQEMVVRVRQQTRLLANVLKIAAESALQNYGQLGAMEDLVSQNMGASIVFYGPDGKAVAPVPTEETPVVNNRVLRLMERNQSEEEIVDDAYAYRIPLLHKGKPAAALELNVDLITAVPRSWFNTGAIVVGSLLALFALLVGFFARKAVGRPIDQLMSGMDQVIGGDITAAVPLDRNDEIGRLAYRFNEMTARLRDAQVEIRRSAETKLQLEQRLRQSEKLATIGQLSAEIAHEVGTPLNVIGGRARSLERKADQVPEVLKNSRIIADQAERITKIIQQVLDLSRARIPEKLPVKLAQIMRDALSLLEYQIERGRITVSTEIEEDLPLIMGDSDGFQQVFINLLHNAIQAMPEGGALSISIYTERRRREGLDLVLPQRFVVVVITDTGQGIPEDEQSQIFEPFYSTKRKGEGTGLGLTVVHGIVKQHDGWVEVQSATTQGTTFRVYLPLEEEDTDTSATKGE
jgi:signal transduction histidine kinase